ncbi:MAG TPA: hypothetical protein PKM18_03140, partial [bacterium]|nr:hypothetical protein [bacterium]
MKRNFLIVIVVTFFLMMSISCENAENSGKVGDDTDNSEYTDMTDEKSDDADSYDVDNEDEDENENDEEIDDDNDNSLWLKIEAGYYHTCGIHSENKSLYCWGANSYGQLGDGTDGYECMNHKNEPGECSDKTVPIKVDNEEWLEIAAGAFHTCGIKKDKKLYCWGSNRFGEIGDGKKTTSDENNDRNIPVKVNDDEWIAVTAGYYHTCAIKTDDTLYCWGLNVFGQLGLGDEMTGDALIPAKLNDDKWISVTAGGLHTCGINKDNNLYCWGKNSFGEVGDGTNENRFISTKIGNDKWKSVSAGHSHSCGINIDGRIYCWGDNILAKIGDGTETVYGEELTILWNNNKNIPVKISNEFWASVNAGGSHTCGIHEDKSLYCWGGNNAGQAGDGKNGYERYVPTKINDDKWNFITTGSEHTCCVKSDGNLYCWGLNSNGQIGDGENDFKKTVPVKVDDDSWVQVNAGFSDNCGIRSDSKLYCWGFNSYGQIGDESSDYNKPFPVKVDDSSWKVVENGYY